MSTRIEELMTHIDMAKARLNSSIVESGFSLADEVVQRISSNLERLLTELYELEKKAAELEQVK